MKTQYKPCPFCGSIANQRVRRDEKQNHYVECGWCSSRGPMCYNRKDSIEFWNRTTKAQEKMQFGIL